MDNNPANQQTTPPKPTNPLIWVIFIIVVLAVAGGIWYVVSQGNGNTNTTNNTNTSINNSNSIAQNTNQGNVNTSNANTSNTNADPYAGWGTYSDTRYNFQLRYPSTWNARLVTSGYNDEGSYVILFTTQNESGSIPFLSIRDNWSAEQERTRINEIDPPYTKVTSTTRETISGKQYIVLSYKATIGLTFKKAIYEREDTAYMFNTLPEDVDMSRVISSLSFSE